MTQQTVERPDNEVLAAALGSPDDGDSVAGSPWLLRGIGISAGVVVGIFLIWIVGGFRGPTPQAPETSTIAPTAGETPPPDTLGISFGDLKDGWNALEKPPFINADLRRVPESGPLDSFAHRFDESAVVAGAYQGDDYVVALMVRSSIHHPAIGNMYLHVCYIVDPFSQSCIDNYLERGLDGKNPSRLGRLSQEGHEASWNHQGNHWQVTIEDDIQTIRVIAPGAQ